MIDYEKNLHAFVEKFKAEANEKQYGFLIIAASSQNTEFALNPFPAWSCISHEDSPKGPALRVRAKVSEGDELRLASSMHVLLTLRDIAAEKAVDLMQIAEMINGALKAQGVDTDHTLEGEGTKQ